MRHLPWLYVRTFLVVLALGAGACDAHTEHHDGAPDASALDAEREDAAAPDAQTADAFPFDCAPERTRVALSPVIPEPPERIEPGSFCDGIFTSTSDGDIASAIELAAPSFQCDENAGYFGCSYFQDGWDHIVTADVMADVCAVTLVIDPTTYVDCMIYI